LPFHPFASRCQDDLSPGRIHVLIEKPIAASITEAGVSSKCAAGSQCILQVGHIERFNSLSELSKVLKTGKIAEITQHA